MSDAPASWWAVLAAVLLAAGFLAWRGVTGGDSAPPPAPSDPPPAPPPPSGGTPPAEGEATPGGTPPPAGTPPGEAPPPDDRAPEVEVFNIDLSRWKLTLPVDTKKKGVADEVKQPELATWNKGGKWFRRLTSGALAFAAPVIGATTKGSENPRSELREMADATGKTGASWSSTDGKHELTIDQAFTRLPDGKPHIVGGQIHDAKNDVSVFRLEGNKLYVTRGNDDHFAVADADYKLGARFEARYVVEHGIVTAFYNGREVVSFPAAFDGAYFRGGAYVQANESNAKPATDANYGEVVIYGLTVAHAPSAPPATDDPGDPPTKPSDPPPAGPGPVVGERKMIIRHGEKDDNKDGKDDVAHHLSARGRQRADGLRVLFTTTPIRTGLSRPTALIASQGKSSSRRMSETLAPLAAALGLPMDTSIDAETAVSAMAKLIVNTPGDVLACEEHSILPKLGAAVAKLLGVPASAIPKKWPDDRFDVVWVFTRTATGWVFTQVPELVLPGDKATAI